MCEQLLSIFYSPTEFIFSMKYLKEVKINLIYKYEL